MNARSVSDLSELEPSKLSQPEGHYPHSSHQLRVQPREQDGSDLKRRKSGYVGFTTSEPDNRSAFYGSGPLPVLNPPYANYLQPQPVHPPHPAFTAFTRPLPVSSYSAPSNNMTFPQTPLSTLSGSPYPINALTYSSAPGNYILTGSADKKIRLYNPFPSTDGPRGAVKAGKLIQTFTGHGYDVADICVARCVN